MAMIRREFLKRGAVLLPTAALLPSVILRGAYAGVGGSTKNLILLEMGGGNDGLNTIVPFGVNGGTYYSEFRPTLNIPDPTLLKVDTQIGFNPALAALKAKLDQGKLALIQGVSYPNPNFSHEIAAQIWAKGDPTNQSATGWVGRLLNQNPAPAFPVAMDVGDSPNLAYLGADEFVPAFWWLGDFNFPYDGDNWWDRNNRRIAYESVVNTLAPGTGKLATVGTTAKGLLSLIDTFKNVPEINYTGAYPDSYLSDSLKMILRLMVAGVGLRVFHLEYGGFDTHSEQEQDGYHSSRLQNMSEALDALYTDLTARNLVNDTVIVVYSEFGRTCYENGSDGTDHGTVNPVMVLGGGVTGGVKTAHPAMDPNNLDDDGELPMVADFRNIFAELGQKLYGVPAATLFPGFSSSFYGVLP